MRKLLNGTYRATNTLGASVNVTKGSITEYLVVLSGYGDYTLGMRRGISPYTVWVGSESMTINVKMTSEEARTAKGNMKAIAVCKLNEPLMYQSSTNIPPKLDAPFDIKYTKNYIYAKISEIWLYDYSNGKVYAKINEETLKSRENKEAN